MENHVPYKVSNKAGVMTSGLGGDGKTWLNLSCGRNKMSTPEGHTA